MTVPPGFLHAIDVLPLARRNLTVARAFFWLSAVLTRELAAFRKLAQAYGRMTDAELASALSQGDLQELFP